MFPNVEKIAFTLIILMKLSNCDKSNTDASIKFDNDMATIDRPLFTSLYSNSPMKPSVNNKKFAHISSMKKSTCCTCTTNCASEIKTKLQKNNLVLDKENTLHIVGKQMNDRTMNGISEARNDEFDYKFIDKAFSNSKKRLKLDMPASIRYFVNQLRPQSPLSALGFNSGLSQMSYNKYGPISAYNYGGYRPSTGNLGANYDIAPGYSDFTPFTGLGTSLGTPYGSGLGIGSSFGIYDNIHPTSISTSKSSVLRRKLVPSEGVLLLEVEDQLNDALAHDTLPLTSGRHRGSMALGRNNFGPPKFSIQLSSNSPVELNPEITRRDLFYGNHFDNQLNRSPPKPNLTKENLANFNELSRNPHQNRIDESNAINPYRAINLFKS